MASFAHWSLIQEDTHAAILGAADRYQVPRAVMLAVAGLESGFNPQARGDPCAAVGLCDQSGQDEEGYCSFGLYQFNRCGGAGSGHPIAALLDAGYNAELAARTMRARYDATGSWYEAIQPWSVRPTAWTLYQQQAEAGAEAPAPGPSPRPALLFWSFIVGVGLLWLGRRR